MKRRKIKRVRLIFAPTALQMLFVRFLHFIFLSSPNTHRDPARKLSRLVPALSNEHGFSFIAQTFTILFAMYQPAVWQRQPLYYRDIFWLFFSFSRLQWCVLKRGGGGGGKKTFNFCPPKSLVFFSNEAVLFASPCQGEKKKIKMKRSKVDCMLL